MVGWTFHDRSISQELELLATAAISPYPEKHAKERQFTARKRCSWAFSLLYNPDRLKEVRF